MADNLAAFAEVVAGTGDCAAVVGYVDVGPGGGLVNAAAVCRGGQVLGRYVKRMLPNYGVFDEQRWFVPGDGPATLYEIAGVPVGVTICEDMWFAGGPMADQAAAGARLLVNANASPYSRGRREERLEVLAARAAETGCAIVYVNQVGGQDELVFDGASVVVGADGGLLASAGQFVEEVLVCDLEVPERSRDHRPAAGWSCRRSAGPPAAPRCDRWRRCSTPWPRSTRRWCWAPGTTWARTASATRSSACPGGSTRRWWRRSRSTPWGRPTSTGWPCRRGTRAGARCRTPSPWPRALGIDLARAPIEQAHGALADTLAPLLGGEPTGLTDENLQSRIRGVLLMALSNANGWIVLTTGNKSEMATGYSTLYGDSAGGFAVIKDVAKTLVYELCRYRNARAGTELIPESVLVKAPVGRAASGPARRRVAASLRGARPGDGRLRRGRPVGRRPGRRGLRPRGRWPGWWAWSTVPSTSGARCRRGSGSRARPSARIGACRSPTTTARWPRTRPRRRRDPYRCLTSRTTWSTTSSGRRARARRCPLETTAALVGEYRWIETALYATLGAWVSDLPLAGVQVRLDAQSMRHAWHAELFADRLPVRAGVDPDALTRPVAGHRRAAGRPRRRRGARGGPGVVVAAGRPRAGAAPGGAAPAGRALPGGAAAAGDDLHAPPAGGRPGGRRAAAPRPAPGAAGRGRGLAGRGAARAAADAASPRRGRRPRVPGSTSSRWPWRPAPTPAW